MRNLADLGSSPGEMSRAAGAITQGLLLAVAKASYVTLSVWWCGAWCGAWLFPLYLALVNRVEATDS